MKRPGVLRFDLHNMLLLMLLFGFSSERAGPSSQRPDLLKYSALETRDAGNKQRTEPSETERRLPSFNSRGFLIMTLASADMIHTKSSERTALAASVLCLDA